MLGFEGSRVPIVPRAMTTMTRGLKYGELTVPVISHTARQFVLHSLYHEVVLQGVASLLYPSATGQQPHFVSQWVSA